MSGPAFSTIAPCSRPSTPLRAALGGGLRPALTAPARNALRGSGRDGETPFNRTKKHSCSYGSAILQNLTHTTTFHSSGNHALSARILVEPDTNLLQALLGGARHNIEGAIGLVAESSDRGLLRRLRAIHDLITEETDRIKHRQGK